MSKRKNFDPRAFMLLAIEEMKLSVNEPRNDGKESPKVGAVLIKPDDSQESSHRGELRYGDHAEFSLLERKNRKTKLDGSLLFTTLEPCAPGARNHPKLSCAERIVNARIKEVWVGIEDPDPNVDRKGIKLLQDHGITVNMFDPDLQKVIRDFNKNFIAQAEERAKEVKDKPAPILLSKIEDKVTFASLADFSNSALEKFLSKANISYPINSSELNQVLMQLGILSQDGKPTGIGLLLFGNKPQLKFPQAIVKAEFIRPDGETELKDFQGPLVQMPLDIIDWVETRLGSFYTIVKGERKTKSESDPFREAIINAIVHRDYDIEGAPIYLIINQDKAVIKSPGAPVSPISVEQLNSFTAPSLSRNPKIMYIFNQLDLVEQRGKGMSILKKVPDEFQLPLPHFSYDAPYLEFTLFRTGNILENLIGPNKFKELNKEEKEGLLHLYNVKSISKSEYAKYLGINAKTAQRHLSKFKQLDLVYTKGSTNNLRYFIKF
jgi:ATP-dependent DNA helicase RecG